MTPKNPFRLKPGDVAPAFSGPDQTGKLKTLAQYGGTKLVLYFYPAAFTPGCTTESCDFSERYESFTEQGYEIVGVSPDDPDKLADFRKEYELPFDLIADPDHRIAEAYGAYGIKKNYGREYLGIIRSTFLIAADGLIEQAFYNVKATGHAARIAKTAGI